MKRQPTDWEKLFANDATTKGLTFQNAETAHTALYQRNKQLNQNMGRRSKETFL